METYVLAIQAQILQWTGLICLAYGLYCGYDPLFVAWRAVLAALLAMIVVGFLMRRVVRILVAQASLEDSVTVEEGAKR